VGTHLSLFSLFKKIGITDIEKFVMNQAYQTPLPSRSVISLALSTDFD
jgi:hypothetical protein